MVESRICTPIVLKGLSGIDEFLTVAQSILQRRKSRAGRSLEHHVAYILREAGIPFDDQPEVDKTRPDILIPGRDQYNDLSWPLAKLFVVGLKTTCKDRWRQVKQEAPRIPEKIILTLQNGISIPQMEEMENAGVTLVVPKDLHVTYPEAIQGKLLTVEQFIGNVRAALKK